jgi:hypothetical protein
MIHLPEGLTPVNAITSDRPPLGYRDLAGTVFLCDAGGREVLKPDLFYIFDQDVLRDAIQEQEQRLRGTIIVAPTPNATTFAPPPTAAVNQVGMARDRQTLLKTFANPSGGAIIAP